jgi:hypothetical protein
MVCRAKSTERTFTGRASQPAECMGGPFLSHGGAFLKERGRGCRFAADSNARAGDSPSLRVVYACDRKSRRDLRPSTWSAKRDEIIEAPVEPQR